MALSLPFIRSPANFAPSALQALLAVAAVYGVVAAGLALWPEDAPAAIDLGPGAGLRAAVPALVRLRCETCGVVEAIRHVVSPTPGGAVSYEFAVRMPDGSLRRSSDTLPGRWQVGDHMQLIGGERS